MPVIETPTLVVNGSTSSVNLFAVNLDLQLAFNILPANTSSWTGWKQRSEVTFKLKQH